MAYAVWAVAVAVAALLHEWQISQPSWLINAVVGILAIGVLLKPVAVPRLVMLLLAFAVELILVLPDPSNHTFLIGVVGATVTVWWLLLAAKSPADARDPGYVLVHLGPFLRLAFVLTFYVAAFAKLNNGFLDRVGTCSAWIFESIPFVSVPGDIRGVVIGLALFTEFAIPTMLIFRKTRSAAAALGLGFHLVAALAGHTPFSAFAWSFYLLFLPAEVLTRVAGVTRRLFDQFAGRRLLVTVTAKPLLLWVTLAATWIVALSVLQILPDPVDVLARRWGAAVTYTLYTVAWALMLLRLRRHWLRPVNGQHNVLRVSHALMAGVLLLLVVDAATPYLGLKTQFAFTMFSNLRTEPGLWNHIVMPEAVRVFDWQEGRVRFEQVSDPALAAEISRHGGDQLVLLDARRLAAKYPDAVVRYEHDGVKRVANPVASDPVLGVPLSDAMRPLAGFRPIMMNNSCQQ